MHFLEILFFQFIVTHVTGFVVSCFGVFGAGLCKVIPRH